MQRRTQDTDEAMPGKPTDPVRGYSFSGFSANNPTAQQPGSFLDQEFDRLAAAIAAANAWVNGVVGADGNLNAGIIQSYHLAAGAASAIAGQVTAEAYAAAAQAIAANNAVQAAVISGPVLNFNGRSGAITPQVGDYAAFYVQPAALSSYVTSTSLTTTLAGYVQTAALNSYALKQNPVISPADAANAGGNVTLSGAGTNRNIKINNNAGQLEVTDPSNPTALSFVVTPTGLTYNGNTIFHSGNTNLLNSMARNAIINGAFQVNQRGYVSAAATVANQYTFDRWKVSAAGGITFSTASGKTTVTIPAGQTLQQIIEGINLDTATYVLSWEGTAQARINGGSYGNSGAVTAALSAGTNATIEFGPGTVTRVKLEKGSTSTAFEVQDISEVLRQCQRYYEKSYDLATAPGATTGVGATYWTAVNSTVLFASERRFAVPKRATPTMTLYNPATGAAGSFRDNSAATNYSASFTVPGTTSTGYLAAGSAAVLNNQCYHHWTADAEL